MRRAKIRPSINLAASRRTVPAPGAASSSSDRSLKSPAKNVPSSPAKTAVAAATARSSRSSSVNVSVAKKTEQSEPKVVLNPVASNDVGARGSGRTRRNSVAAQEKQATAESAEKPLITKASATEPSKDTPKSPITTATNDKPQEPTSSAEPAPKGPRGRRKHAPNILNIRTRPRQPQRAASQATTVSDTSTKAKESENGGKQSGGCEDVSKVTDDGGTLPPEPPPVQRLASADKPVPVSVSKSTDAPKSDQETSKSSAPVQDFPIHQDVPASNSKTSSAVAKMPSASSKTPTATTKATATSKSTPLRMIGPPEKKNPMNIYERKLRELKETLEEETPAKRRRRYVKKNMPKERGNMTMSDLIYYNPRNNPMKQSAGSENRERTRKDSEIVTDLNKDGSDVEEDDVDQFAPQVKIGPDGELILDQKSLMKDASPKKSFDPSDCDIVHEEFSSTTYASFRKRYQTATWSKKDTDKFYRALSAVGTDFSMINAMFPKRTRRQIKNKFKREERHNRIKVDTAIRKMSKVCMSMFDPSDENDSGSETENRPSKINKSKTAKGAKGAKGRKRKASGNAAPNAQTQKPSDETESTADKTDNPASVTPSHQSGDEELPPNGDESTPLMFPPKNDTTQSEDSEEDISMETILSRPTRSGRQPKFRTSFDSASFTAEAPPARAQAKSSMKEAEKASKAGLSSQQHGLLQDIVQEEHVNITPQTSQAATTPLPSMHTFVAPTKTPKSTPRTQNNLTRIQHIIINSPVPSLQPTPSPVKTHIYVINSPDGSQRIIQVPVTSPSTPVVQIPPARSNSSSSPLSPIVIHRVQATQSQPMSTNVQTISAPGAVRAPAPQNVFFPPQRLTTLSPAARPFGMATSSLAKSPMKHFLGATPPKVQRKPLVLHDNTAVNVVPTTSQHIQQLSAGSPTAANAPPRTVHYVLQQQGSQQAYRQQIQVPSTSAVDVGQRSFVVQQQQNQQMHIQQSSSAPASVVNVQAQNHQQQHHIRQLPSTSASVVNVGQQSFVVQKQNNQQHIQQLPSTSVVNTGERSFVVQQQNSQKHIEQSPSATSVKASPRAPHFVVQQQPQHIQLPVTAPTAVNVAPKMSPAQQHVQLLSATAVQRSPHVVQQQPAQLILPLETAVNMQRTARYVSQVQQQIRQHQIQSPTKSSVTVSPNTVIFQQVMDPGAESDPVVAQQIDIESFDRMSESGASETGSVFIPPISAAAKATVNFTGMEQNSDQLMITGLGSDGFSTRDIFEQISYEQDVVTTTHESVGANMEVTISSDMISQIATEIATE